MAGRTDSDWMEGRHVPAGLKCNFCSHEGKKEELENEDLVWGGKKMAICRDCSAVVSEIFSAGTGPGRGGAGARGVRPGFPRPAPQPPRPAPQ